MLLNFYDFQTLVIFYAIIYQPIRTVSVVMDKHITITLSYEFFLNLIKLLFIYQSKIYRIFRPQT